MTKLLNLHLDIHLPHKPDKKELAKLCHQLSLIHGGRIMSSSKLTMIDKTAANGTLVAVEPTHGLVFFQQSVSHMERAAFLAIFN